MAHERFSPVWISTDEQIAALSAAYAQASVLAKAIGRFNFAPGTAHIRCVFMPWAQMPIVFTAVGDLKIAADLIEFSSIAYQVPGWRVHNVRNDLRLSLSSSEVLAVEAADVRSPVFRYYDIPFTRVRTMEGGLSNNLLLCVGGRLSMGKVRTRSMELRAALERFAEGRRFAQGEDGRHGSA